MYNTAWRNPGTPMVGSVGERYGLMVRAMAYQSTGTLMANPVNVQYRPQDLRAGRH